MSNWIDVNDLKDSEIIGGSQYCPICCRRIFASNIKEVESGEHDGYIFVHDDINHSDNDVEALGYGLN